MDKAHSADLEAAVSIVAMAILLLFAVFVRLIVFIWP